MKKDFIYISLILVFVFFTVRNNFDIKLKSYDSIEVDSTKVDIKTEVKKGSFTQQQPKPIIINNYISDKKQYQKIIKELESKYNKKIDSITILKELLEATKTREYKEVFNDSVITAEVKTKTKGTLESIDFSYKVKPQKVSFYEKTITKRLTPKFSLLVGGRLTTSNDFNKSSLELNIGTQFKNMDILEIGYDINKSFTLGYKFNVFTRY